MHLVGVFRCEGVKRLAVAESSGLLRDAGDPAGTFSASRRSTATSTVASGAMALFVLIEEMTTSRRNAGAVAPIDVLILVIARRSAASLGPWSHVVFVTFMVLFVLIVEMSTSRRSVGAGAVLTF